MASRKSDDFFYKQEDLEEYASDAADKAFWDEFWLQENSKDGDEPMMTITIKNQETGEEKVVENVRLKFRSPKLLKD